MSGAPLAMADILTFKRTKASERHRGKSLCRHGHHKWEIATGQRFDVKQGRLVTNYRCSRCGATKNRAT
ncbi:MAG: hypothetical protein ABW088_14845 [Sedimenticola sp.]